MACGSGVGVGVPPWPWMLIVLTLIPVALVLRRRSVTVDRRRRGAILRGQHRAVRSLKRRRLHRMPPISLAGRVLAASEETRHFKLIGTTGTGKSTAIHELIAGALERGDRAVIADPDGAYLARFFHRYRGDVLLNPFEDGSPRWDPFAEVRERHDVEELASALIPTSGDPASAEWRGYARTLLAALLARLRRAGGGDLGQLWRLLVVASPESLRPYAEGSPAQPFLEVENARMFASIRSVAASALAALPYVDAQRSEPFCVRDWVERGRGVLFIPYRARQIAALRTLISTWVRLAIFELMSQTPDEGRRLWFVVDELDALGAIDGLKDALARLRKFGGRCVLGIQSIAQVSGTYGPSDAQTIVENCANTLILRCSASEHGGTAQFASRLIGEREVLRRQVARSRERTWLLSGKAQRGSIQVSEQPSTESAVLASEIEQLPDLTGYLKTAAAMEWIRVRLTTRRRWPSII